MTPSVEARVLTVLTLDCRGDMNKPNAQTILKMVGETLNDRSNQRDLEAERSMARTIKMFNTLHGTNLTEAQGWTLLALLKMVRGSTGKLRPDDFIDLIGYCALLTESVLAESSKEIPDDTNS